jgi:hypothetical protein
MDNDVVCTSIKLQVRIVWHLLRENSATSLWVSRVVVSWMMKPVAAGAESLSRLVSEFQ